VESCVQGAVPAVTSRPETVIWMSSIEALDPKQERWLPPDIEAEPVPVSVASRRSTTQTLRIVLRACRPRQWSKNVLLLAAPAAAGVIAVASVELRVAAAIVSFCMLSSATYLLNDVRDRDQDRLHPRKRLRPIASGELSSSAALAIAAVLGIGGLALAAAVRLELAAVGCAYLALTASYSLWWRRVILLDILAIAGCFLLRAAAGGVAADVRLSRWFLVVTSCCAIFVVTGKRHAELVDSAGGGLTRATLRRYSQRVLRILLVGAASGAVLAYAIWAVRRPEHGPWYEITIVPFVLWLGRYGVLIARGGGEAPEEVILHDWVLLALGLGWTALFLCGIYVGR
jgi:decaprenyl-phosphate phosphoribosyltransferase